MVRIRPQWFVATVTKSKRTGKILIDYLRNSLGASSIVPYSTRARPEAPWRSRSHEEDLTEELLTEPGHGPELCRQAAAVETGPLGRGAMKRTQQEPEEFLTAYQYRCGFEHRETEQVHISGAAIKVSPFLRGFVASCERWFNVFHLSLCPLHLSLPGFVPDLSFSRM